jgi:protein gp37
MVKTMGSKTGIAWTDATWNPWQGCTKVSQGCKNCYMYREKTRYVQDPMTVVKSKPHTFNAPLVWAKNWDKGIRDPKKTLEPGSRIFVCSWSDFYHQDADDWRAEAWELIRSLPQYTFLIPTKRIERYGVEGDGFFIPQNVWLGVSVENQQVEWRVRELMDIPAAVKWVSYEPLLGPVKVLWYPDWAVIGGESGSGFRPMDLRWAREIMLDYHKAGKAVFVKQLGGWPNTRHELTDFPEDLRVREFPNG